MSLILEALRRAEQDRESLHPAARPLPLSAAPMPVRRRPEWAALAAVLALVMLAWLLWPETPDIVQPVAAPAVPPAPPETGALPPEARSGAGIQTLDDVAEPETAPVLVPLIAAEPVAVAPSPAPVPTDTPPEPEPADAAPEPAPAAAAAEPVAVTAPAEAPAVPAAAARGPLRLNDMPPGYRADFPALQIIVHAYNSDPAQRFARIGRFRYVEGERLAEGPTLVEITRDGLVLDYRGERVLLPLD